MMTAIGILALLLALAPMVAILLILLIDSPRAAEALNLAASAVSLAAILAILALDDGAATFWGGYVVIDGLGTWTVLCAAIVYCLASLYGCRLHAAAVMRTFACRASMRCLQPSASAR